MPRSIIVLPVAATGAFDRGTVGTPPGTPASFAAGAGNEQITLSWVDTATETGYHLYWSLTSPVTTADTRIDLAAGATSYVHTGLTNGTAYYYKLAAFNGAGEGTLTAEKTATPASYSNTKSFLFGGTDEYANFGNDSSLDFERTDTFSISLWIKRGTTGGTQCLFARTGAATAFRGYGLIFNAPGQLSFDLTNTAGSNNIIQSTSTTYNSTTAWYHVVVTYDGSSTRAGVNIYVDDVVPSMSGQDTLSATTVSTGNFMVAKRGDPRSNYLTANIDEVSVWDKELSAAEVSEIYNSGTPDNLATHSAVANIISWWRMGDDALDDGTGTTGNIQDQVDANHGTPQNTESGDIELDVP